MTMLPQDYHLHSHYSCDCHIPMAEMAQAAVDRGVAEIGFTEHYDLHPAESCRDWFRLEPWAEELARTREQFAGRLVIRAGIEVGEPHRFPAETQAMLASHPFDYALGSLHWVGAESVFDLNFYQPRPPAEAYRLFFEELERMTRAGGFDILSHFDLVQRIALQAYGDYDLRPYADLVRPVLRNCVERGIALDVNAALLRRKYAQGRDPLRLLTPGVDILRWYAELGGERVTLGSDAHKPHHLGAHLDVALEALRQAGLKYLTFFEGRQARLEKIDLSRQPESRFE